jgi:hypothetical protein
MKKACSHRSVKWGSKSWEPSLRNQQALKKDWCTKVAKAANNLGVVWLMWAKLGKIGWRIDGFGEGSRNQALAKPP